MLCIENLNHTYPNGVKALNEINLTISKGMFGLLGPNGAGKTSLMRTIATLQQPSSGNIVFNGTNALTQANQVRRVLGYLPQDFGVYPRSTAHNLLDHLAILKGVIDKKSRVSMIEGLLHQTNLYQVRHKKLSTFSGGMLQRFGIAQALIGNPKLIIVDEPTAGLDPEERNRFHNLLSEIGEDIVVLLSTHIVSDVADLCTDMAILAQGNVIRQGKPTDLIKQLHNKIWVKKIEKKELQHYRSKYTVISNHFSAGKTVIRIYSEESPELDFLAAPAVLEDVYFLIVNQTLNQSHGAIK